MVRGDHREQMRRTSLARNWDGQKASTLGIVTVAQ